MVEHRRGVYGSLGIDVGGPASLVGQWSRGSNKAFERALGTLPVACLDPTGLAARLALDAGQAAGKSVVDELPNHSVALNESKARSSASSNARGQQKPLDELR